jgi:hypothetical protein
MNNHLIHTLLFVTSSVLILASCGENNDSFTEGSTSSSSKSGTVSQKNLSILAEDPRPKIFENGFATDTTLVMTVKVGDSNNQLLTDPHTVFFATEWGLIEPSCITENGTCTVNWQTSFGPGTVPSDHLVTIVAYTLGEEDYSDSNGNGVFDDDDLPFPSGSFFIDRQEPFVDADRDGIFSIFDSAAGDKIIDVIDGNILGKNNAHDNGDGFLNSPSCKHSSLCSTVSPTTYIWDDITIDMDGPPPAPATP